MKPTTITTLLAVALAATLAAGCFNPFRPLVGTAEAVPDPPPNPTTPVKALQLLRWCWVNRQISEYEELFTDDFEFAFSDVEAVDNLPIPRWEEIDIARKLFIDGSASEPRAKRIDLEFSGTLTPIADQRPGKISPWHKQINTGVVLRAELVEDIWLVQGDVTFYLTRSDSAAIPKVLLDRGFKHDGKRWYIERWEDKTASGQGGASLIDHFLDLARARSAGRSLTLRTASSEPRRLAPAPAAVQQAQMIKGSWGGLMRLYRSP